MKIIKLPLLLSALLCISAFVIALSAPAQAAPAPETQINLPSGQTLILRPDHTAPRVAISLQVRAGAANETVENAGWRRLLTDAILRASRAPLSAGADETFLTGLQLQRLADVLGGQLGAAVGDDNIAFSLGGSSAKLPELLALIQTLVEHPRLSDSDIDRARRGLLAQLDAENNNVAERASTAIRERLYRDARGELVAYGLPGAGTLQSLNALTAERVRELHRMYFDPARQIIAIAGDFDADAVPALLQQNSPAAPKTLVPNAAPYFAAPDVKPPLVVRQMETPGAWVFITYATGNANNVGAEDWPALQVLAAALGKSPQARLPKRLLDTRGRIGGAVPTAETLVIDFAPRRFRGEFVLFALTAINQVEGVKNVMLSEVQRLKDTPLSATALASAKNFARGAWATDRQTLQERAYQSALAVSLTTGSNQAPLLDSGWPARLQKVSAADVQKAAGKYLQMYAVALVLPQLPTGFGG